MRHPDDNLCDGQLTCSEMHSMVFLNVQVQKRVNYLKQRHQTTVYNKIHTYAKREYKWLVSDSTLSSMKGAPH